MRHVGVVEERKEERISNRHIANNYNRHCERGRHAGGVISNNPPCGAEGHDADEGEEDRRGQGAVGCDVAFCQYDDCEAGE